MSETFKNNAAFMPFYTDSVSVKGVRANKNLCGTFRACVFDMGLGDALSDSDTASSRKVITVEIPKCEMCWIGNEPHKGDTITLEDGEKFKVVSVSSPLGESWSMEARQA